MANKTGPKRSTVKKRAPRAKDPAALLADAIQEDDGSSYEHAVDRDAGRTIACYNPRCPRYREQRKPSDPCPCVRKTSVRPT